MIRETRSPCAAATPTAGLGLCHLWRGRHNSTVWQTDLLIADGVLWLHNVRVNPNEKYVHGYDWTNAQARRTLSLAHHSNTMRAAHLNLCYV